MQNLKYGSYGPDVTNLQQFLASKGYYIKVDGDYGINTKEAVIWYQRNEKLYVDSRFGPGCIGSMHRAKECKYQEFKLDAQTTVIRMNKKLTKAKVLNPKAQTVKQMFKSEKITPSLVVNGSLFDTKTMTDLSHLKINGVQKGIGYYDDDGLRIAECGLVSIGKDSKVYRDFMGFAPSVMLNGYTNLEYKNLVSYFLTTKHPRTMIQVTDKYINVFIIRGRSYVRQWHGANITKLLEYSQKMARYDNDTQSSSGIFDGGGSTGAFTKNGYVIGYGGRKVANGVAFYVEDM